MRNRKVPNFWARLTRLQSLSVVVLGIFFSALVALYLNFAWQIRSEVNTSKFANADAIVVLTGENNRIKSAIDLLHSNHGERLLISGVNKRVSKDLLKHTLNVNPTAFSCCVDLDYLSLDTKGNAKNASYWAKYHDFDRLIIVTSDYHMPRSLVMMQRAMPRIELIPAPVTSPEFEMASFVELISSPVILKEFGKYIIVQLHMEPAAKYLITAALSINPSEKQS